MSKILIIEDEMTIVDLISFNLKREGFEIDAAYDGVTGLEKALSGWADLILLDVMLPGMNGFELLQELRKQSEVPVIMVTAREEERDKVLGLETGADDYMTKPFSVKELVARIKANTRRVSGENRQSGSRMGFGPYTVDTGLQTQHLVPFFLTGSDHDHRHIALLPQLLQQFKAVHTGQHHIQQDQIGPAGQGLFQTGNTVIGGIDLEALSF